MTSRPWTFRAAAIGVALAAATATCSAFTVAQADSADQAGRPSAVDRHDPASNNHVDHDLEGPLSKTQAAQREEALNQVLSGRTSVKNRDGSKVVQLKGKKGDSKYVELGREKTDKIFTILVEFGDKIDSRYGGTRAPCTTRSPSRTARATTPRPGRRTTTSSTSRSCTSVPARASTRSRPTTRSSPRAATRSTARSPTG